MREYLAQLIAESGTLTAQEIVLHIIAAAVLSVAIYISYWYTHAGTAYSKKFNVSLVTLTILTATVMTVIGNNIALSLGMVGALSIVRFRTAIKEPLDIAYLFWAIAAGIVLAAGMIPLAVFGSVVIGVMLLVLVNRKSHYHPYIAMVTCDSSHSERLVADFLAGAVEKQSIKSKTVTPGRIELNYEVRLKNGDTAFINGLSGISGVTSVALVSYNGEYMN